MPGAVDVVIAASNEAAKLGECLAALATQTYAEGPITVIVVDDASTDATTDVARRGGATVLRGAGAGPAAARNAGLRYGAAPLVAFLDAHSIPEPNWVSALTARFVDPQLGGCQAATSRGATDPRVDALIAASGAHSDDELLDLTVSGRRSLYPWLLTGNCMYRRAALDDAGMFDESLAAAEDVDLAWRVVLAGWLLAYEPETGVVHHEGKPLARFLRKGWRYGRGAAQLTGAYMSHGVGGKFSPRGLRRPSRSETISNLYYWAGFTAGRLDRRHRPEPRPVIDVRRFRDPFVWQGTMAVRISPRTVYWFRGASVVAVQLDRHERVVLDGVGAFVWRSLTGGASRKNVIDATVATYAVQAVTAAADVDDFVRELLSLRLLEEVDPAGG